MRLSRRAWAILRRTALERDGYRCRECGKAGALEVDHRVSLRRAGTNDLDNLQALCRKCHIFKTRNENATIPRRWDHRQSADRLVAELT